MNRCALEMLAVCEFILIKFETREIRCIIYIFSISLSPGMSFKIIFGNIFLPMNCVSYFESKSLNFFFATAQPNKQTLTIRNHEVSAFNKFENASKKLSAGKKSANTVYFRAQSEVVSSP